MVPTSEHLIREVRGRPGIRTRKLASSLDVAEDEFDALVERLLELQKDGVLLRIPGHGWHLPEHTDHRIGTLRMARGGYGFVNTVRPDPLGDIFIPAGLIGSAFDGDLVLVELAARRGRPARKKGASGRRNGPPAGRPEARLRRGRVVDVVERRRALVHGRLRTGKRASRGAAPPTWVEPAGDELGETIYVPPGLERGALDGQKVLVRLLDGHAHGVHPRGEVVHVAADDGSLESDFGIIAAEYGFPVDHPAAALSEAAKLPSRVRKKDTGGREDLRDLLTFTIDPKDARDFDDAVSLEALGDGTLRLGVHIADVSHFVRPGSALDESARARGTSIYFPGRVVPMLPEKISNDLASLLPETDRLTKTVLIDFDAEGTIVGSRVVRSVIRSRRRFTYAEVLAILEESDRRAGRANARPRGKSSALPADAADYAEVLGRMAALRDVLHRRRLERGSLVLELPRLRLRVDPDTGDVVGIGRDEADASHLLIEEFMLAANETVAGYMEIRGLPWVSRAHDEPDAEGLEGFFDLLAHVEGRFAGRTRAGRNLREILERIRDEPWAPIVNMALLRSLPHAEYRAEPAVHYALAVSRYCHFTSPIRRYPDLLVHQILDGHFDGALRAPRRREQWKEALPRLSADASAAERRAEEAEREMVRLRLIRHLAGRIGEEMEATIVGVHPFGFFVQDPVSLIDGLVHVSSLGDDYYEFNPREYCLRGARRGREFRLGERVRVVLAGLDTDAREIRLECAGDGGERGGGRTGKKKRRSSR